LFEISYLLMVLCRKWRKLLRHILYNVECGSAQNFGVAPPMDAFAIQS